ncbi:unnamed protein product [Debaryomyces fabryi]|nr:unnamed protein product [Debaryomyces fabryi]
MLTQQSFATIKGLMRSINERNDVNNLYSLIETNFSMSSFVIKYITNRVFKDNQWTRFGVEDPYYEYVPIDVRKNEKVQYKKIPRRVPDGLSKNDETILHKVKKKAYRYDMWFSFLGIKFGFTNVVGIIPIAGTVVSTYWSLTLLQTARQLDDGLPLDLQLLFLLNIVIDFLLGLIPIVGDIIEVGYKSNLRNFLLLEKHLTRVGKKNMGIIGEDEVRPNFINDKIQPFVDTKVKPGAIKAGEQIKSYIHSGSESPNVSALRSLPATIQTHPTTVTTSSYESPLSLRGEKNDRSSDDTKSIRSLSSTLGKKVDSVESDADEKFLSHHVVNQ